MAVVRPGRQRRLEGREGKALLHGAPAWKRDEFAARGIEES